MPDSRVAIIGGTGLYKLSFTDNEAPVLVETKYGSVELTEGEYKNSKIFFMTRHGGGHTTPPHLVNYKAIIAALKKLAVDAVISTAAVGTLQEDMPPRSRIVIDQFIDFTKQRTPTFYEGDEGFVVHTDLTEPYCPEVRAAILKAGAAVDMGLIDGGCYVCCEGPRFETPAEIRMIKGWGGDLVGMTNYPEVVLAREAGLCYATIALATNYAAGISPTPLTHDEVLAELEEGKTELDNLLAACVEMLKTVRSCSCSEAGKHFPKE